MVSAVLINAETPRAQDMTMLGTMAKYPRCAQSGKAPLSGTRGLGSWRLGAKPAVPAIEFLAAETEWTGR
jgi:hypothetical protein